MLADDTLDEIERRALEISADLDAKLGPYSAQIVPDCTPQWHVITTAPSGEAKATQHLCDRGFGIYRPQFQNIAITRGRRVTKCVDLFPRHLFVFTWDVLRHWRRIKACPGVSAILTIEERPVVVSFEAIQRMQAIEFNGARPLLASRRRRRKRGRPDDYDDQIVSISCKSYWTDSLPRLDEPGRISALHKALGL